MVGNPESLKGGTREKPRVIGRFANLSNFAAWSDSLDLKVGFQPRWAKTGARMIRRDTRPVPLKKKPPRGRLLGSMDI
ncbi:hypothetical protein FHX06_005273 [Rhizobium sp. BK512]|nr:hypothetical protein [Rhizobium sp. BK512]